MSKLITHREGHYQFLTGIDPYSCGVVATPGQEIVHVTLRRRLPWREGFERVDRFLADQKLPRTALCAMELRSPAPFTMAGFIDFNRGYCAVLDAWGLKVDQLNPLARTNVAPVYDLPETPSLHGFSFVRPQAGLSQRTFVVAGAGELREGTLDARGIIRCGEVSAEAMHEKARYVLEVMDERLHGLGAEWDQITAVNIYTVHPLDTQLRALLVQKLGLALQRGIVWHWTRPPVQDIEFEMDLRGVVTEWVI
ncbi:MAG: hypothetical protein JNN07_24990 [Verrucomicrobiales bacterium]|nr:hypothetical protein [Verrucomicrobiales bacterium]